MADGFGIEGVRQHLIVFGAPQLHRHGDMNEPRLAEREAQSRRGRHHRLDPRIMYPGDRLAEFDVSLRDDLTVLEGRVLAAVWRQLPYVRLATRSGKYGEATGGKSERTDASPVDMIMPGPGTQQVVRHELQLARAVPYLDGMARIVPVVAIVRHGSGDVTRLGQGDCGVEMAGERPAMAVRHQDQRKVGAAHRAVDRDMLAFRLNRHIRRRRVARIPDADFQRLP